MSSGFTEEWYEQWKAKQAVDRLVNDAIESVAAKRAKPATKKKRGPRNPIRQSSKEPNKTEAEFRNTYIEGYLRDRTLIKAYSHEAISLEIGNGVRYSPDWPCVTPEGRTVFYEIKGGKLWDDAVVKLKAAARIYEHYEFWIAQKDGGVWGIYKVLP